MHRSYFHASALVFLFCAVCHWPALAASPRSAGGYPDDAKAILMLRDAVRFASQTSPEWALEKALRQVEVVAMTPFENVRVDGGDSDYRFPVAAPAGIKPDEWTALLASRIDAGGEHGIARYFLLDIDGDGERDLVATSYVGGTALASETRVMRRVGPTFSPGMDSAPLYVTAARGGLQEATWIELGGQVYVAYRDSMHGEDKIVLITPSVRKQIWPLLKVRYRYQLTAVGADIPEGVTERPAVDPALRRAIATALPRARANRPAETELCPVPPGTDDDARDRYLGYGSPHYSQEFLGDAPVWLGRRCLLGQHTGRFGAYGENGGLVTTFCMRAPAQFDDQARCFRLGWGRKIVGLSVGELSVVFQ